MERGTHGKRTLRLLESKLEVLAHVSSRPLARGRLVESQLECVAAATRRAVELGLVSREEADEIWERVVARHPDGGWRDRRVDVAA
ncbi:MAG: hypothetical protein M3312_06605 [Actinomycetota bacterium]|nr:hypothetical protein [Actinomycetota bacterium]